MATVMSFLVVSDNCILNYLCHLYIDFHNIELVDSLDLPNFSR